MFTFTKSDLFIAGIIPFRIMLERILYYDLILMAVWIKEHDCCSLKILRNSVILVRINFHDRLTDCTFSRFHDDNLQVLDHVQPC